MWEPEVFPAQSSAIEKLERSRFEPYESQVVIVRKRAFVFIGGISEMDEQRFDELSRVLGGSVTRKGAVRALFGLGIAGVVTQVGSMVAGAKGRKKRKKKGGHKKNHGGKRGGTRATTEICYHSFSDFNCKDACVAATHAEQGEGCQNTCEDVCGPGCPVGTENRQCECAKYCDLACFVCEDKQAKFICKCDECKPKTCKDFPGKCGPQDDGCDGRTDDCQCAGDKCCEKGECVTCPPCENPKVCSKDHPCCSGFKCCDGTCVKGDTCPCKTPEVCDHEHPCCGEDHCCDGKCQREQCPPKKCPGQPCKDVKDCDKFESGVCDCVKGTCRKKCEPTQCPKDFCGEFDTGCGKITCKCPHGQVCDEHKHVCRPQDFCPGTCRSDKDCPQPKDSNIRCKCDLSEVHSRTGEHPEGVCVEDHGCVPELKLKTCNGRCGPQTNNCGDVVHCRPCNGGCKPTCLPNGCGPDGCGGSCGDCPPGQNCTNGICCEPQCSGKQCGRDGCGGLCGVCPDGQTCLEDGTCSPAVCVPPPSPSPNGGPCCTTADCQRYANDKGICENGVCVIEEDHHCTVGTKGICAFGSTCVPNVCRKKKRHGKRGHNRRPRKRCTDRCIRV